ncbi:hypothetical protein PU634_05050 [Oceanimonas pelagia]|uniref:Terminase n=1 Tax=Oceanimonas pelagia TaxID=3028314 RepID=A0AA50KRH4_9GAMM|nr:hypothetical protein [Oceanimonas pelagia]WMC11735.1 hypothetical protein PU634_05050 [Oceanimonas pelagia]
MAVPKLTAEQWAEVRRVWETDSRDGYTWLVRELELPVSAPAVRKTALKQEWSKVSAKKQKPKMPAKTKKPETKSRKPKTDEKPETRNPASRKDPHEPTQEEIDAAHDYLHGERGTDCSPERTRARTRDPGMDDFAYGGLRDLLGPAPGGFGVYRREYSVIAFRFMLLGATMEDLASLIGVSKTTLYTWMDTHPEFSTAINNGRNTADANVASRLYQRAMGYTHEAEEIKVVDGGIERVMTTKHYPPDPQSARFWLINRQPELWKEKVEVIEKPTIALVDKEAMDKVYEQVLQEAEQKRAALQSRAERLGLLMDSEKGGAVRDDEVIIAHDDEGDA